METQPGYLIAGAGKEVFTRFQIRDKIRAGEVIPQTEVAQQGSEEYRAADSYPELARYFSLLSGRPAAGTDIAAPAAAAAPASGESVGARLVPGLVYPFTGPGAAVLLLVAALEAFPFIGLIASAFLKVYQLAVIRTSAKGSTRMPPIGEVGEAVNAIVTFLKVIVIGICSTWPILATLFLPLGPMPVWFAMLFTLVYAPASFALLAKTDRLGEAINPTNVVNLMMTLGGDYALAFLALFIVVAGTVFVSLGSMFALYKVPYARYILAAGRGVLVEWAFFYFCHLVGWAMYRRT
jgi:uncharacterized protein DUF4013